MMKWLHIAFVKQQPCVSIASYILIIVVSLMYMKTTNALPHERMCPPRDLSWSRVTAWTTSISTWQMKRIDVSYILNGRFPLVNSTVTNWTALSEHNKYKPSLQMVGYIDICVYVYPTSMELIDAWIRQRPFRYEKLYVTLYDRFHFRWFIRKHQTLLVLCIKEGYYCNFVKSFNSQRPSDAYMRQWNYHHWSRIGLSSGRRQAIIWTNAGILLIGPLGIDFSENLIEINIVSFNKMHLKMSSAKWRLFRFGLNVLNQRVQMVLDKL